LGDAERLEKLSAFTRTNDNNNVSLVSFFLLENVEGCVELLIESCVNCHNAEWHYGVL
uniref:Uncharacterized protein n=1 Tax=Physcomitrium patens TaxID=3218 RepID=A0A7I4ESJ3_PHYPA